MEPAILVHIILGSTLSLLIILTIYYILRMLLSSQEQKANFKAKFKRFGILTVVVYVVYMGWVFIKNNFI
ncbi:hypothetical protein BKP35_01200 [Anaerobacillus arseniciselenatis]|uniref:Uncharacterized protein n=1 Tax=Anaerobacillus arseniciselenatis TaxID=85682 RepID=A0A1S2LTV7_9BACI|nr:hypothetical protein [Anaerobacillus arseniciselenatis]OIJ15640.1 hypothetical protein BKP35_01200 [Anaerobacillus arseniciselenatis]